MPKRGRGGGEGQLEDPLIQGEGGRCLQDKSSGLIAGDVPISHNEEMEKAKSPGWTRVYLEVSCKEDVHKINP